MVFARLGNRFPRLQLIGADGSYAGKLIEYVYYWYTKNPQESRQYRDTL